MNALEKSFNKLEQKYSNKRDLFKKTVEKFKIKGKNKFFLRSSELCEALENLHRDIKVDLTLLASGQGNVAVTKGKLKKFKALYKEMYELTKSPLRQWVEAIVVALGLALVLRNFIFGLYHVPTGSAEPTILVGDRIWGNKMAYYVSPVKRGDLVIFDRPDFEYDQPNSINYFWQKYIGFPIPLLGLGSGPDNWVKRVIAIPGDTIEGRIEDGKTTIYLNGKKLNEPYVNQYPLISIRTSRGFIPWSHIGLLSIPSFLRYETEVVKYTYDPSKKLYFQPFYAIDDTDIVKKPGTNEPELDYPYTPIYDNRSSISRDTFGPFTIPAGKYWVMGDSRKNSIDSRWWLFLDESFVHGRASFIIYSIDSKEAFWLFDLIKHPIEFWTRHTRWNRFFRGFKHYD